MNVLNINITNNCKNIKDKMYYFVEDMNFMNFIEDNTNYKIFDIRDDHLDLNKTAYRTKVDSFFFSFNIKAKKIATNMLENFNSLRSFLKYNEKSYLFFINYQNNEYFFFRPFINLKPLDFLFSKKSPSKEFPINIIFNKEKFAITQREEKSNNFALNLREIEQFKKYLNCFFLQSSFFMIFLIKEVTKLNRNILKFSYKNGQEEDIEKLIQILHTNLIREIIQMLY